ncbi:MAG: lactonase family protein [Lachnospiraceae bacterium]|nr:lactonase family protein [Lachnospiraceae bacterium]
MAKYVAYLGSYTNNNSEGIHIYDLDVEQGVFTHKDEVSVNNPSYLTISKDKKHLYSIVDEGISAFEIEDEGYLSLLNTKWIGGMRGCYVTVDSQNRYLFIGGYHDGRITVMSLLKDGSIGEVTQGIFHEGLGISSVEKRLEPKITCVELSPDEKYLYTVDYGIDNVSVYEIDYKRGKLKEVYVIRCPIGAAPRMLRISKDGKFLYILSEKRNKIEVYKISSKEGKPEYDKIQTVSVIKDTYMTAAAATLEFSDDEKYMFASVDAVNSLACLKRNTKTGELTFEFDTRVSGDYPKYISVLPGNKLVTSVNHDSNEMRTFEINYEKKYALMRKPPVKICQPNCMKILKMED